MAAEVAAFAGPGAAEAPDLAVGVLAEGPAAGWAADRLGVDWQAELDLEADQGVVLLSAEPTGCEALDHALAGLGLVPELDQGPGLGGLLAQRFTDLVELRFARGEVEDHAPGRGEPALEGHQGAGRVVAPEVELPQAEEELRRRLALGEVAELCELTVEAGAVGAHLTRVQRKAAAPKGSRGDRWSDRPTGFGLDSKFPSLSSSCRARSSRRRR